MFWVAVLPPQASRVLDAFTAEDATASSEIIVRDRESTIVTARFFEGLIQRSAKPGGGGERGARLLFVQAHRRIGDYGKDIAAERLLTELGHQTQLLTSNYAYTGCSRLPVRPGGLLVIYSDSSLVSYSVAAIRSGSPVNSRSTRTGTVLENSLDILTVIRICP